MRTITTKEKNMALSDEIVDRLMGDGVPSVEEIEKRYPPRALSEGQCVTRIAPSPTGFMHLGALCGFDFRAGGSSVRRGVYVADRRHRYQA